jgi:heme exporter protein B
MTEEPSSRQSRDKGLKPLVRNAQPRPTPLLKAALAIVRKDLRAEMRSKETLSAMLVFALLAILIFSFALELDRAGREAAAAGVLWVTLVFAGTLGLGRSLGREKDEGCLDGLLLTPVDRSALYFGKLMGNFIFMTLIAIILLPLLTVLFNISFFVPMMPVVLLLGVLGYAGVGTLIASMSVYTRSREVLLPILLLPIALSILIPAVRATRGLLEGIPPGELLTWFNLLIGANVIYITLAYMLFDTIVEE